MTEISGRNGSYVSMRPRGHDRHLAFGDRGRAKCAMGPKQSLEGVLVGLKSPCLRAVQRNVLGLQCHSSGCNFWLEWFIWIDGTQGTYPMSRFGDGSHVRCSMGPKKVAGEGIFSLKSPCLRGVQQHILVLQYHPSGCYFRLE